MSIFAQAALELAADSGRAEAGRLCGLYPWSENIVAGGVDLAALLAAPNTQTIGDRQ